MSLQIEQESVYQGGVGIPGVARLDGFVASVGLPLALQPVMLDVIDDLEFEDGDSRGHHPECHCVDTQGQPEGDRQHQADRDPGQGLVARDATQLRCWVGRRMLSRHPR